MDVMNEMDEYGEPSAYGESLEEDYEEEEEEESGISETGPGSEPAMPMPASLVLLRQVAAVEGGGASQQRRKSPRQKGS